MHSTYEAFANQTPEQRPRALRLRKLSWKTVALWSAVLAAVLCVGTVAMGGVQRVGSPATGFSPSVTGFRMAGVNPSLRNTQVNAKTLHFNHNDYQALRQMLAGVEKVCV